MPISLSAKKSLRRTITNRSRNVKWKSKYKEIVKKYLEKPSKESLGLVYAILDKLGKNHIFHRNKIARLKSKFARVGKKGEQIVKKVSTKRKTAAAKKAMAKKKIATKKKTTAKKKAGKKVVK